MHHSQLDNIGSRSLNRSIHCSTFSKRPEVEVAGINLRQIAAALQQGRNIALLTGILHNIIHILAHALEDLKILLDEPGCFLTRNVKILR
ncbi:hypothetical protein D3C80_1674820 [compost metagenome]